jgi:hypothetical protein
MERGGLLYLAELPELLRDTPDGTKRRLVAGGSNVPAFFLTGDTLSACPEPAL